MSDPGTDRREMPWLAGAVGWVVLFTLVFYAVVPTGADVARGAFWSVVPFQILDVVDPPEEPNLPPAGWSYLPQRFDLFAVAALILFGSRALGAWLLRLPTLPNFDARLEREVFAWGLGLSAWSLVVLGLGLVGALSSWLFGGILAGAIVSDLVLTIRGRASVEKASPEDAETIPRWVWAVAAPFLVLFVLGAVLPPTEYDAKGYHLLGPKEFFLAGRVGYLPHNVYTSFPFLTEMLTLSGMVVRGDWFRGALVGRLVLAAFGPLTAMVLFVAVKRWFGTRAGWLAALVHLTLPWTYVLSTTSYVEGALGCYLLLTFFAALRTIEVTRTNEPSANGWALLTGLMAGTAMACKYPALPLVIVPAALVIVIGSLRNRQESEGESPSRLSTLRVLAAYIAGVAITVGPWLLKNLVETGNPVYPLAHSLFGGGELTQELADRWSEAHSPDDHAPSAIPSHVSEMTLRNPWLSPLLYAFAPLALFVLRRGSTGKSRSTFGNTVVIAGWAGVLWIFIVWWGFTHRIDRFWAPMLPVVSLLAGIGASRFEQRQWRIGVSVLVGLSAMFSLALVTTQVTSGQSGFNSYLVDLDAARPVTERITAPAVFAANASLPADAVVLCVGEAQVFDAGFRPIYHTVFNESDFERWCAVSEPDAPKSEWKLRPTAEIREQLNSHGVTHVLANWAEISRYRAPGSYGFSAFVTPDRIEELRESGLLRDVGSGPELEPGVPTWTLDQVVR